MCNYSLSQVPDSVLERDLVVHLRHESSATALVLAHLAEVDARKLYAPAGYPSLLAYCVERLSLPEDAARKRIHAARAARRFPMLFEAVADGRLHLSGVVLLAAYLSPENADELIARAAGKSKAQIEEVLAQWFPRSEPLPMVIAVAPAHGTDEQRAPGRVERNFPETSAAQESNSRVMPTAAQRYEYRVSFDQEAHEDFEYARALVRHAVPSGDRAEIMARAFKALIREQEKSRFGAASRHRSPLGHASASPRHIPTHVKHAVWERDDGRCTFVSDSGHRCSAREWLEWDHIEPVACGGGSNVENIRLRCRTHNQFAAERQFGSGFMRQKRAATVAAKQRPARAPETTNAEEMGAAIAQHEAEERATEAGRKAAAEVVPYLRSLGFGAKHAAALATVCEAIPDAPLEDRVKAALKAHGRARLGRAG